jgi:hypothetical protein
MEMNRFIDGPPIEHLLEFGTDLEQEIAIPIKKNTGAV